MAPPAKPACCGPGCLRQWGSIASGGRAGARCPGAWWLIPRSPWTRRMLRAWAHACDRGRQWPPEPAKWRNALRAGQGRGSMRALSLLATRLGWEPCGRGWRTLGRTLLARGRGQHPACHLPDFKGLEHGVDPVDFCSWRRWASGATHAKRAAVNVALGGAWADQRCSEAFGGSACCSLRGGPAGTTNHQTYECPASHAGRQRRRGHWEGGRAPVPCRTWVGANPSAHGGPHRARRSIRYSVWSHGLDGWLGPVLC